MKYKYEFGEAIEWEIDEDEGMFIFSTLDDEGYLGPFDIRLFINDFDWQDEEPIDPEDDPDSWYLDNYKIYKIEFYPEDEETKVTEEELMKKFGITKENLEYLKQMADDELANISMGIWMDYFGVHVNTKNN